jgi:hypothetical protein
MPTKTNKTFSDSQNWDELVKRMENSIGVSYKYSEGDDASVMDGLVKEFGSDIPEVIRLCTLELEPEGEFDEVWSRIKAAGVLLTRIGQGHMGFEYQDATLYTDAIPALWRAAERCGVDSYAILAQNEGNDFATWQKHKFPLDSILFALANTDRGDLRMERYFNSGMTDYWKSFFVDWDIAWHGVDRESYFSQTGHRKNHKIMYYGLLAYRLENYASQFSEHSDKVESALSLLSTNPENIPLDRTLRKRIYEALSYYLHEKQFENTFIFNKIFEILRHDTIGFILTDPRYQEQEAGKVLLDSNEILEKTWDTNNRLQGEILPVILAAMDYNDEHVQKKAKEFLKKRAPNEIQQRLERLIDELDSTSSTDKVSSLISNLIEFGSEVAIKTVLKRCVVWISTDENWSLVERAAQKFRVTSSAIQPLVYQLNAPFEDKSLREKIRTRVRDDQDVYALMILYQPDADGGERIDQRPIDRLQKLEPAIQIRYLEMLEDWAVSFESRSKAYADQIALWRESIRENKNRNSETVELGEKILALLTREKMDEHRQKVQRWITALLSQMSDPRYFDRDQATYKEIKLGLEKFAIEPLSKRLPTEEDLEMRENIVRVLGNVGGAPAVDALVRTVSGNERERKARQELLAEYYLKPSKQRSEEAAGLLQDAVENAKRTMRLLQVLNTATFVLGAMMLIGGIVIAVVNKELGSRFVGIVSGLGGVGAIVTIFLKDPLKSIQNAMGDLVQLQTAFTGFVWDLNLNGTYIQSQYVADGTLADYDVRQTSKRIADSVDKTMSLIQVYAEGELNAGPPTLNYMLPPAAEGTLAVFGHNLYGYANGSKKTKFQIAVNHKPVAATIESWTDHFVITQFPASLLESLKAEQQSSGAARLWISVMVDEVESNTLPFSLMS